MYYNCKRVYLRQTDNKYKTYCNTCERFVDKYGFDKHLLSNLHEKMTLKQQDPEEYEKTYGSKSKRKQHNHKYYINHRANKNNEQLEEIII